MLLNVCNKEEIGKTSVTIIASFTAELVSVCAVKSGEMSLYYRFGGELEGATLSMVPE